MSCQYWKASAFTTTPPMLLKMCSEEYSRLPTQLLAWVKWREPLFFIGKVIPYNGVISQQRQTFWHIYCVALKKKQNKNTRQWLVCQAPLFVTLLSFSIHNALTKPKYPSLTIVRPLPPPRAEPFLPTCLRLQQNPRKSEAIKWIICFLMSRPFNYLSQKILSQSILILNSFDASECLAHTKKKQQQQKQDKNRKKTKTKLNMK